MASVASAVESEASTAKAIDHFRAAVHSGGHWYLALLDALGHWMLPEETYQGRRYCYLIEGEAFDWLLLAERLCAAVADILPEDEVEALLFRAQPPIELSDEEFQRRLGPVKAWAHLNYFYGVTVEEALLLATEERLWKEQHGRISTVTAARVAEAAFERLYGEAYRTLLGRFQREKGYPESESLTFWEWKQFTYWLFRYRVRGFSKARVASDTKRGLEALLRHRSHALPHGRLDRDRNGDAIEAFEALVRSL